MNYDTSVHFNPGDLVVVSVCPTQLSLVLKEEITRGTGIRRIELLCWVAEADAAPSVVRRFCWPSQVMRLVYRRVSR